MTKSCPICSYPTIIYDEFADGSKRYKIVCYKCGQYNITEDAINYLKHNPLSIQESSNLSGWLISNQKYTFLENNIKELRKMNSLYVDEKAEILFREIVKKYQTPGDDIPDLIQLLSLIDNFKGREEFPNIGKLNVNGVKNGLYFYAKSRCQNLSEFVYLFNTYIVQHKKYLTKDGEHYKITPDGWSFFTQIQNPNQASSNAFIAMKFEDKLKKYSDDWFETAIKNAGYRPIRIDKHEHNNLIDDEIIANIRKSKFVIADFTNNSFGVYYESGYARGLNIPVIYLCNKECFQSVENRVHFDANHYSFLLWEWDKGQDLSEKLKTRIEATIGKGDYIENIG
jgi:nucleoside 2-deoxyribosyltransferase